MSPQSPPLFRYLIKLLINKDSMNDCRKSGIGICWLNISYFLQIFTVFQLGSIPFAHVIIFLEGWGGGLLLTLPLKIFSTSTKKKKKNPFTSNFANFSDVGLLSDYPYILAYPMHLSLSVHAVCLFIQMFAIRNIFIDHMLIFRTKSFFVNNTPPPSPQTKKKVK